MLALSTLSGVIGSESEFKTLNAKTVLKKSLDAPSVPAKLLKKLRRIEFSWENTEC